MKSLYFNLNPGLFIPRQLVVNLEGSVSTRMVQASFKTRILPDFPVVEMVELDTKIQMFHLINIPV